MLCDLKKRGNDIQWCKLQKKKKKHQSLNLCVSLCKVTTFQTIESG
jgi:hypothetical protein